MIDKIEVSTNTEKLKELRLEHGYSQAEVSELIGLNEGKTRDGSNYGKRERGVLDFSIKFLVRLSRLYGVALEELLVISDLKDAGEV